MQNEPWNAELHGDRVATICLKWISATRVSKYGKSEYSRALNASYTFQPLMSFWSYFINVYKITKIVRALWLAERSVCMRLCKHGCDVKMFCFSRANHASTNLKKFSSSKLDKFILFTHSFVGWNLKIVTKTVLSEKNRYFGKHLYAKQKLITRARLRGQDFETGEIFSFSVP